MSIFTRSRRRATAPLALALWLFALAMSIAHACGVVDQLEHAGIAKAVSAVAAHREPSDETLPACDQFCADDTPLLSKLKAVEDSPAVSVVAYLRSGVGLLSRPLSSSALAESSQPPVIAVNTRFARLAL